MILDAFTQALQKDLDKITWLPILIFVIKIIIFILIIITIIDVVHSIKQTKKYTTKIYELLENSPLNKNDNKKED